MCSQLAAVRIVESRLKLFGMIWPIRWSGSTVSPSLGPVSDVEIPWLFSRSAACDAAKDNRLSQATWWQWQSRVSRWLTGVCGEVL